MAQTHNMAMHPAMLKAFGIHQAPAKNPMTNTNQEEEEKNEMAPHGMMPSKQNGGPTAPPALHPKLQMLMQKLSPMQEEEPEEEGQFSPGRLESGMA